MGVPAMPDHNLQAGPGLQWSIQDVLTGRERGTFQYSHPAIFSTILSRAMKVVGV